MWSSILLTLFDNARVSKSAKCFKKQIASLTWWLGSEKSWEDFEGNCLKKVQNDDSKALSKSNKITKTE